MSDDFKIAGVFSEADGEEGQFVKRKNVCLTLAEKKQIILEIEHEDDSISQRALAKRYGISKTTLGGILKDKEKILKHADVLPETSKRAGGEKYRDINDKVHESFLEYKDSNGKNPTGTWIKKEALYFAEQLHNDTFAASNGWLDRFLKKHHIRLSHLPPRPPVPRKQKVETDVSFEYNFIEENDNEMLPEHVPFKVEMDLCRLCGAKNPFEALCSLSDVELQIEIKLQKVFNVKLNNNKLLPQNICFNCISSLESSLAFLDMVDETQITLIKNLNDQLMHCNSSFMLESDIKIEEVLTTSIEEPCSSYQHEERPLREPKKRIRNRNPLPTKTHNPVMRMEDIFKKELSEGIFEAVPEILDVEEHEQNSDGALNDAGVFKMTQLGWYNYNWRCVECQDILTTRTLLEEHFKIEHKHSRMTYACMDCKASFKGYLAFNNHVTESHRPYMKFFCDICCDFRWNLMDLYKHREEHHPKLRSTCLYCGRIFDCGFNLKQHIGIHLKFSEEELFRCDICEYQCHTKYLIKQHVMTAHVKNHGEIVCEQCGKICKRLSDMRSHQLVHTQERPHACDLCDLKFKCPKQLRCHKRTHFPRLLREECEVCHKKFLTKGKLDRHFLIHTNSFAYTCEFCGRKFKHSSGFNTHRRIHTGERPYVCSYEQCGQKFIDWPNMNKHMKTKHQVDNSSRKKKIIFDHLPGDDILL